MIEKSSPSCLPAKITKCIVRYLKRETSISASNQQRNYFIASYLAANSAESDTVFMARLRIVSAMEEYVKTRWKLKNQITAVSQW